jgi:hypothetical protein
MPATMPQIADVMIFLWPAGRTAFDRLRRKGGHPIARALTLNRPDRAAR